ncbi:MAG: hypothetical protein ACRDSL_09745 [Pseudonocardiaceae bacterium]
MKPAHGGYAEYLPPRGLAWVWWVFKSPSNCIYRRLRRMYRRRWPQPEVSRYIGMAARVAEDGATGRLYVGSVGVVTRSEVLDGDRVYIIEFDAENETLMGPLPAPRIVELMSPEDRS